MGGEHDPLRLCRSPLRLSRSSGNRRQGEPDDDDDHRQHAGPDRGAAPSECGAAPQLVDLALAAVDHSRRHFNSGRRLRGGRNRVGVGMIGCDETTARARPARFCPGGVRRGGRRDRGARLSQRDGGESAVPTTGRVGADHRRATQRPDHRRGDPRRPRSHGAPRRSQHDAWLRCPARIGMRSRFRTPRTSVPSTRSSGIPPAGVRMLKVLGSSRRALHPHGPEGLRWQPVPDGRPLSRTSSATSSISRPRAAPASGTAAR